MEYLYIKCRDWDMYRKQKAIYENYGFQINADTLNQPDNWKEYIKKVFTVCTESKLEVEELLKDIQVYCSEKGLKDWRLNSKDKTLENVVEQILKIIYEAKSYESDIVADVYMAWLWRNVENDINYTGEIEDEWNERSANEKINGEAARENYPFAKLCEFPENPIHGGCKVYHSVMMRQENIGVFDYAGNTQSLQRYAYYRTKKRYLELKDAPIENMLLLERTQGIEYTNVLFEYLYNIKRDKKMRAYIGRYKADDKDEKGEDEAKGENGYVVQKGLMMEPMFLRTKLIRIIMSYIKKNRYSSSSLEIAGIILDRIIDEVNWLFECLFEVTWVAYYFAYMEQRNGISTFPRKSIMCYLKGCWEDYYCCDDRVYDIVAKNKNLHDWTDIQTVEDCFTYPEDIDRWSFDTVSNMEVVQIIFANSGIEGEILSVRKALNPLGQEIRELAIEQCCHYTLKTNSKQEMRNILYDYEKEIFQQIKESEEAELEKGEPRLNTQKLKPMHVYAILHRAVIGCLGGGAPSKNRRPTD